MKVRIQHALVLEFHAVGTVEFMPEYLKKVETSLRGIATDYAAKDLHFDMSGKCIVMEVKGIDLTLASEFKHNVLKTVVLLAEHGPHADILDALLIRHPELKNHPRLGSLVNSFENMTSVLTEILEDKRGSTMAEVQKRDQDGIDLVVEDLQATNRMKTGMTPAERAEFRNKAILGQTSEQIEAKKRAPRDNKAGLPDVYNKIAAQQKADPEAAGDAGNVFTTPAKGGTT